ncbi:unnamed protein product [Diamesa serratosioi]
MDGEEQISWSNSKNKRSAFIPYNNASLNSKGTTVLTNLQRGNTEAKISSSITLNFHEKTGQGEISEEEIRAQELVNLPDKDNFTPLHWACYYGQLKTAETLIECGADVNYLADNYVSPLHLAASEGHHEIVRLLIQYRAKINQMDIDGNTPLHFAASNNHPHSTNELLNTFSADILLINTENRTAYHLAVEKKSHLSQTVIENFMISLLN